MEGSGFPVAKQVRVTLVPSLMVISFEMSYIFGGTEMGKHAVVRKQILYILTTFLEFCVFFFFQLIGLFFSNFQLLNISG